MPSSFKLAYLQSYERRRNPFTSSLVFDHDLLIVGLKIVLTLSADTERLNYPSRDWWTEVVLFSAPDLCAQTACNVAYLIVNVGYSPKIIADCLRYLHDDGNCESKIIRKVIKAYNARPLSLLQLSRKAVRKCMRDGHVLEDCYKLPIPTSMQDYLSLRCLNAPIRKCILKEEKPSCIDYKNYDFRKEVMERYKIEDEEDI